MLTHHLKQLNDLDLEQVEFHLDQHTRSRKKGGKLSWSYSRHRMFNRCKRQYYLHYFASKRVRTANDIVVSTAWWLKQLTSLRAWIGSVVHRAAQRLVASISEDAEDLSSARLADYTLALFDDGVQASQRESKSTYSRWVLLGEDAYGQPYDLPQARDKVQLLTTNLFNHPAYSLILDAQSVLENDNAFQSFTVDVENVGEVPVYAIPDVLISSDDVATIIDWKSSTPETEDMRTQASIYSFYTHQAHQFSEEEIRALFAVLDEHTIIDADTDTLVQTHQMIVDSVTQMTTLIEDTEYQTVSIKDFPMTDDLDRCATCSFRRLCWRHEN